MIRDDLEPTCNPVPNVDPERCDGCGLCVRVCASGAMAIHGDKAFVARPAACVYCGLCERLCPVHAICLPIEVVFGEELEYDKHEPPGSRRGTK
jgi:ferredoxin